MKIGHKRSIFIHCHVKYFAHFITITNIKFNYQIHICQKSKSSWHNNYATRLRSFQ